MERSPGNTIVSQLGPPFTDLIGQPHRAITMHDDAAPPAEPDRPCSDHITERKPESLFASHRFPTAHEELAGPGVGGPARRSTFQRAILPVALLLIAIAAIAWISQNLPSWTNVHPPTATDKPSIVFYQPWLGNPAAAKDSPVPLELRRVASPDIPLAALWEPKFLQRQAAASKQGELVEYRLEFEPEDSGYFDYVFVNESDGPAEIGLEKQSCTCSQVRICVRPTDEAKKHSLQNLERSDWRNIPSEQAEAGYGWKDVTVDQQNGIEVPAGHSGLVRMIWHGDRIKDKEAHLELKLWTQPKGETRNRRTFRLGASLVRAQPLNFLPEQVDLDEIQENRPVQGEFLCWSGTRKAFQIDFPENDVNPCLQCRASPLSPDACAALTMELLKKKINSRVLAGYKVTVTVADKKDNKQLDNMGLWLKQLPMTADLQGPMQPVTGPILKAWVVGDVRVAGTAATTLDLKEFPAKAGTFQKFTLLTDKGVKLKFLSVNPKALEVKLKEKGSTGDETEWELTITVPRNAVLSGVLPSNHYVTVESERPNSTPRQMRIPISGTATSSPF
jgi:hypothetical protein